MAEARPQRLKRAVDIGVSLLVLAVAGPAILVVLALVWLEGGGPIYGHVRVGRDGKPFCCWKIRTMVPAADGLLDALLSAHPALAAEWQRGHKLRYDPRVTRLGRWLRLTSFDELPQLWNVLVGEMSVVGPRPVTGAELARYGSSVRHYLRVRPGLTGLWQLNGRNDLSYRRRVALDRAYAMRSSALRDILLILRTPAAIMRRGGC